MMSGPGDPDMDAELQPLPPESQESELSDQDSSTVLNKRKKSTNNTTAKDKKYKSDSAENNTQSVSDMTTENGIPNSWEDLISHPGDTQDTSMEDVSTIKHGVIVMELTSCSKEKNIIWDEATILNLLRGLSNGIQEKPLNN